MLLVRVAASYGGSSLMSVGMVSESCTELCGMSKSPDHHTRYRLALFKCQIR